METMSVYLITTEGNFKPVQIPEEFLIELCRNLRNKGVETVQFKGSEIKVEGVYVPAKGTNFNLMVMPNLEE